MFFFMRFCRVLWGCRGLGFVIRRGFLVWLYARNLVRGPKGHYDEILGDSFCTTLLGFVVLQSSFIVS